MLRRGNGSVFATSILKRETDGRLVVQGRIQGYGQQYASEGCRSDNIVANHQMDPVLTIHSFTTSAATMILCWCAHLQRSSRINQSCDRRRGLDQYFIILWRETPKKPGDGRKRNESGIARLRGGWLLRECGAAPAIHFEQRALCAIEALIPKLDGTFGYQHKTFDAN